MTDLVERLRHVHTAGQFLNLSAMVNLLVAEREEAAAEITRLLDEVDQLRDEVDRLRSEGAYHLGRDWYL